MQLTFYSATLYCYVYSQKNIILIFLRKSRQDASFSADRLAMNSPSDQFKSIFTHRLELISYCAL